jgi:hypothetical protein
LFPVNATRDNGPGAALGQESAPWSGVFLLPWSLLHQPMMDMEKISERRSMSFSSSVYVTDVFWACNEKIHLAGALIRDEGGQAETHGIIEYDNGERSYFRSPATQSSAAACRDMTEICKNIGSYYHAEVGSLKLGQWVSNAAFCRLLSKTSAVLH